MDAQRGDLPELRREMQLGTARIDARFDALLAQIDARFAALDARIDAYGNRIRDSIEASQAELIATFEKGLREQTRLYFLAWLVLLAAIVGLYAR